MSAEPIRRRARRPSSKAAPKPQYADAVWFSFTNGHPLEITVPTRSVEETIRKLKAAARYLERIRSADEPKVEVRVQIGVEPELETKEVDGKKVQVPTKRSVVKFLGHEPWVLGRRVAKLAAENGHDQPEPEPVRELATTRPRRTVAATRPARRRGGKR